MEPDSVPNLKEGVYMGNFGGIGGGFGTSTAFAVFLILVLLIFSDS